MNLLLTSQKLKVLHLIEVVIHKNFLLRMLSELLKINQFDNTVLIKKKTMFLTSKTRLQNV